MNFNENQLKALDIEKNIAVSAGAGSGKTRVLTSRYIKLLEEGNVNVSEIVAITFTNKAALEMKERIRAEIDNKIMEGNNIKKWIRIKEDIQMANISTIHSFCMNVVRENASMIGIDPEFSIIDDYQRRLLFDKILNEEVDNGIEESRETIVKIINAIGGTSKGKRLLEILKKEVESIYNTIKSEGRELTEINSSKSAGIFMINILKRVDERFKRAKNESGLVDFNDLEYMTMKILSNEEIKRRYRNIYKKFLIDEFQDTNELQKKILYSFVWDNGIIPASLFVVGDHKQAIYGFRGTDFRVFKEVMEDIQNTVELDICYRSRPSIIKGINDSFEDIIGNYEKLKFPEGKEVKEDGAIELVTIDCKAEKTNEDNLRFDKIDGEIEAKLTRVREKRLSYKHERALDEEGRLTAESIVKLSGEGYELRDMAILLRSRNVLSEITDALGDANINYVVLGGLGFFDKQEIIDLMFIYNAVIRPWDRKAIFGALRSPAFLINDKVLYNLNKYLVENNNLESSLELIKNSITTDEYNDTSNAIRILLAIRKGIAGKRVYDVLRDILNNTDFHNSMLAFKDGEKKYRNIEKLLNLALNFDKNPLLAPGEFYDYINEYSEATSEEDAPLDTESSDAVKIMTIHASKGLEFKCVLLPYLNKTMGERTAKEYKNRLFLYDGNSIISKFEDGELAEGIIEKEIIKSVEEEQRIIYVAATRAKEKLVLIGKEKKKKSTGKEENQIRNYLDIFRNKSDYISEKMFNSIPEGKLRTSVAEAKDSKVENKLLDFKIQETGKFNFSISRYFEFKSCGRRYYYKYIENIPENYYLSGNEKKMGYGTSLGTAVHEVLEYGINDGIVEKVSNKYNISGDFLNKFINSYVKVQNKYEEFYRDYRNVWIKNEYEVRYRYNDITFTGFIDRLDVYEHNGGYYASVIDYKTNYIGGNLDQIIEKYTPQLTLYSLAVKELIRVNGQEIRDVKAYLFLLDKGILKELDQEKGLCEFNEIYRDMAKIGSKDEIGEYNKNLGSCSSCGYYRLCHTK